MWNLQGMPPAQGYNNINYSFNVSSNCSSKPNSSYSNPPPNISSFQKSSMNYPSLQVNNNPHEANKAVKYCQYSFSETDPKQPENFIKRKSMTQINEKIKQKQIEKVQNQVLISKPSRTKTSKQKDPKQHEQKYENNQQSMEQAYQSKQSVSKNNMMSKQALLMLQLQQNQQLRVNLFRAQKTIEDLDNMCKVMQAKVMEILDLKKKEVQKKISSKNTKNSLEKIGNQTIKKKVNDQKKIMLKRYNKIYNKQNQNQEGEGGAKRQMDKQVEQNYEQIAQIWKNCYTDLIQYVTSYTKDITFLTQQYKQLQVKKNNYKKSNNRSKRNEKNLLKVLHESNLKLEKYEQTSQKLIVDLKQRDIKLQQYQIQNKNLKMKIMEYLQQIQKLRRQNKITTRDGLGFKQISKSLQAQIEQTKSRCKQLVDKMQNKQKQLQITKSSQAMLQQRITSLQQQLNETKKFNQNVLHEYKKISEKIQTNQEKINEKYQAAQHMYEQRINQYEKYISNLKKQRELLVSKHEARLLTLQQQKKNLLNTNNDQEKQLNNKKIHILQIQQEMEKLLERVKLQQLQYEGRIQQKQRQVEYLQQLRSIGNQKNQQLKMQLDEVRNDMILIIDQLKVKQLEIEKFKSISSKSNHSSDYNQFMPKQYQQFKKKYSQQKFRMSQKSSSKNIKLELVNINTDGQRISPIASPTYSKDNSNNSFIKNKTKTACNKNINEEADIGGIKGKINDCKANKMAERIGKTRQIIPSVQAVQKKNNKNSKVNLNQTLNNSLKQLQKINTNKSFQDLNTDKSLSKNKNFTNQRSIKKLKQSIGTLSPKSVNNSMYKSKQKQAERQVERQRFVFIGQSSSLGSLHAHNNAQTYKKQSHKDKVSNITISINGRSIDNTKNSVIIGTPKVQSGNKGSQGLVWKKIKNNIESPSQNSIQISSHEYQNYNCEQQDQQQPHSTYIQSYINNYSMEKQPYHQQQGQEQDQYEQEEFHETQDHRNVQECQDIIAGNTPHDSGDAWTARRKVKNLPPIIVCDGSAQEYGQHDISDQNQNCVQTPKIWNNTSPNMKQSQKFYQNKKNNLRNRQIIQEQNYRNPNNSNISFKNESKGDDSLSSNSMNMFLNRTFGVDLSRSGLQNLTIGPNPQNTKIKFNLQSFQNKMSFQENAKIFLTINKVTLK